LPQDTKSISYKIENAAGKLDINDTENLFEYQVNGIQPDFTTNYNNNVYSVYFSNRAAYSKLKLNRTKMIDLDLAVSAGNLDADLRSLNIADLNLKFSGGASELNIGANTKKITIDSSLGSTTIHMPKSAKILLKVNSSLGSFHVPEEFKNVDGEYIYEGGGNELDITSSVSMGNLEFDF
jgi:hypothetical protein